MLAFQVQYSVWRSVLSELVQGQTDVARRRGECVDGHQRYSPSVRAPATKKKGCEGKEDECSTD